MTLFYFHTETDSRFTDDTGTECATLEDARRQAIASCGLMIRDGAEGFWGSRPWSLTVTDAAGLILWEITVDGVASPATAVGK